MPIQMYRFIFVNCYLISKY